MKFQENKSIVDEEEEESFRAIFPRGSRWLGLGRSGCKVAARRRRRSKFASPAGGGGKEQDRSGGNGANVLSVHFSVPRTPLSPFFFALSIVVGIGRRNSHYKTLVEIVTFQNGLRIMDPCIFIDTLKKYHCPFIFT